MFTIYNYCSRLINHLLPKNGCKSIFLLASPCCKIKGNALVLIEIVNLHQHDGWENNQVGGVG